MNDFDVVTAPLAGLNLIEASAGTGKTYAIANLVVRLVAEQGLAINQILIVTFTEAATAELRSRVRARLQAAYALLAQPDRLDDSGRDAVLCEIMAQQPTPSLALTRLDTALRGFDEAAIFTIHGFCQRVLQDHAFESGSLFNAELLTEQSSLLREIVEDFWRRHFYTAAPLFVAYALAQGYGVDPLLQILGQHHSQPFLRLLPPSNTTPLDLSAAEAAYVAAFNAVQQSWPMVASEVQTLLRDSPALNRNQYKLASLPGWFQQLDSYLCHPLTPVLFDEFKKFCRNTLQAACKKQHNPPEHSFFEQCQQLQDAAAILHSHYEARLLALKHQLFSEVRADLRSRKQARNQLSFDDLLLNLYQALQTSQVAQLIAAIRLRYQAALIDEFQDTDPLQYAIFRSLFYDAAVPEPTARALFLIGDPKQAIYSFRGADIYTYLQAAADAEQLYTLGINWRAAPRLVQAVNALFSHAKQPFLLADIDFKPVYASDKRPDCEPSPLHLWYLGRDQTGAHLDKKQGLLLKDWANREIPELVASAIVDLLSTPHQQADGTHRCFAAGEIAVLVRKNRQALDVQTALRARRVPSVVYSPENLFASQEAQEVCRLLAAILNPGDETRLRSVLVGDLFAVDGAALYAQRLDENVWEAWLSRFRDYYARWENQGFIQMFRHLLLVEDVQARLLRLPDGERRLTNLLHLAELLQQAAHEEARGLLPLYRWLASRCEDPPNDQDSYQLRLESDAHAVKLVTIHKSKGLEYPVVFVPYAWDGALMSKRPGSAGLPLLFHDPAAQQQACLDLGSAQQDLHRQQAEAEERAENLRLLYVALTRAKQRCYLLWGPLKDAAASALGHLLHGDLDVAALQSLLSEADTAIRADLARLLTRAADSIALEDAPALHRRLYQPPAEARQSLQARSFQGPMASAWQVASFSAWVAGQVGSEHQVDERELRSTTPEAKAQTALNEPSEVLESSGEARFQFPAGANAGIVLHDILEHLDFRSTDSSQRQTVIASRLRTAGFAADWAASLPAWIESVLATPLWPALPDFALAQLSQTRRLNELAFYHPLAPLQLSVLRRLLTQHWQTRWPGLRVSLPQFEQLEGFMRGFIDLVFEQDGRYYLVDYKSNQLGQQAAAYQADALLTAMAQHHYLLQYHLYSVALHRYLQLRVPDYAYNSHFGGVFYLFLRGMAPDYPPGCGIFYDRPAEALIDNLSRLFAGETLN